MTFEFKIECDQVKWPHVLTITVGVITLEIRYPVLAMGRDFPEVLTLVAPKCGEGRVSLSSGGSSIDLPNFQGISFVEAKPHLDWWVATKERKIPEWWSSRPLGQNHVSELERGVWGLKRLEWDFIKKLFASPLLPIDIDLTEARTLMDQGVLDPTQTCKLDCTDQETSSYRLYSTSSTYTLRVPRDRGCLVDARLGDLVPT